MTVVRTQTIQAGGRAIVARGVSARVATPELSRLPGRLANSSSTGSALLARLDGGRFRFAGNVRHGFEAKPGAGVRPCETADFLGALKDAMGQGARAGTVEAPIAAYPNFEHLEAEGQRLLPEQLKTMLKALARSNLLRGGAR